MIPVAPAPAPVDFDARVRERGLDAIAELVGEAPSRARNGPKRKKVAATRATIPASCFPPLWREVLPDMLRSYQRTCAYLALYIEHATQAHQGCDFDFLMGNAATPEPPIY